MIFKTLLQSLKNFMIILFKMTMMLFIQNIKKEHNFLRNIGSKINDKFVNFILNKPSEIYLSSFKSIDINLVKEILNYQGPSPYIDGIIFNTTSKIGQIDVDHKPRYKGQSGYTFLKLLKLFSNVAFNFSTKPLRVIFIAGFFLSFFSFLLGLYILVEKYINPDLPLGYASLVLIILFLRITAFTCWVTW